MAECVIIGSRPVGQNMRRYIKPGAFVIAADAGWQRARELGVAPQLVLGDFDSSPIPQGIQAPCITLPAEKDDTDMHFAAGQAIERKFTSVVILGGTGGRADHTMANYATLLYLAKHGVQNLLADENTEVRCLLPGSIEIEANSGCYLSVFAYGGTAEGVTLQGVKYPLNNARLSPDFPLGASNEFAGEKAVIKHTQGALMVFVVRKNTGEAPFAD